MAISEPYTGSTTPGGTETTLNTTTPETTDGVYQLFIDVSAMTNGDTLLIKLKEKARSGDTQRLLFLWTIKDAQAEPLWCTATVILLHGFDYTIQQTTGTNRAFPWSLRKVA
jgi:hypothetical protein